MPTEQNGNFHDSNISRLAMAARERYNSSKQQQQPAGESSFRVLYYGGATGSVPFLWESQPGTPKHTFNDGPPPPLTPPPSYHRLSPQKKNSNNTHKINPKFFNSIFPRANSKKVVNAAASSPMFNSPPSSSSSFSSHSAPSTPRNSRKGSCMKARSVRFGFEHDDDDDDRRLNSPTSTLCFGTPRFRGYSYPVKSVKKVVLSIVGG